MKNNKRDNALLTMLIVMLVALCSCGSATIADQYEYGAIESTKQVNDLYKPVTCDQSTIYYYSRNSLLCVR